MSAYSVAPPYHFPRVFTSALVSRPRIISATTKPVPNDILIPHGPCPAATYTPPGTSAPGRARGATPPPSLSSPTREMTGFLLGVTGRKHTPESITSMSSPRAFNWAELYPAFAASAKTPEFADVGCGFGGLLIALAPLFPDTLMLGQSPLRLSPTSPPRVPLLHQHLTPSRQSLTLVRPHRHGDSCPGLAPGSTSPAPYQNVSIVRANSMKFTPNYFPKHSLSAMFFLFPDPHFKSRKHKARIISPTLLAEYAYVLKPGGIVYTITDVQDLHEWMKTHLEDFPLFQYVSEEDLRGEGKGPILDAVYASTEEGKKVERNKGDKWLACFRRIEVSRD
ncbi:hypothetical protein EVJ58_g5789 [Rhodofomes roseus]|uniref:tRNA (guanine-N(7)-)-methyltransferase n=1 Tax=Rhodofomes roseus TaxID=34475 RepID=A0A4Y9YD99_9APHY|nr:hypothetical protein EVJ58_g5789 [Rhodofomes roseus]